MKTFIFGQTASSLPILGYQFEESGPCVLVLGGVHGDEIEGVWAASALLKHLVTDSTPLKLNLTIVPTFNLDGVLRRSRVNDRQVDLNRNLPTKDWSAEISQARYHPGPSAGSEPENQALMSWLDRNQPQLIISLHSWKPLLNINGGCRKVAERIAQLNGYAIEESIGYPTPGCLGTYAGLERGWPTLTYEIERGSEVDQVVGLHIPALMAGLKAMETE